MKIAILGTRGIPANYSGFETSVEETAYRFAERGHDVTVYCRTSNDSNMEEWYRGVRLVHLSSMESKHLDTPIHTTRSIIHLFKNSPRPDIIQMYGVGNSLWLFPLLFLKSPLVSIVDGLDWKRKKWGKFASWFLRISERFTIWWADEYVVDSRVVISYYDEQYKKKPVYIPYGANIPKVTKADNYIFEFGLEPRKYILFVGRFVPEKGIHHLIHAFEQVDTDMKLVVVGDNVHDKSYVESLKSTQDPRIIFPGFAYGDAYVQLNSHAYVYVQPSELEGTSPALLGAMGFGNCVLVSDIPENCETIGDVGVTFHKNHPADLAQKLQELIDDPNLVEHFREMAPIRIAENYDWEKITDDYERLFFGLLKQPIPPRLK